MARYNKDPKSIQQQIDETKQEIENLQQRFADAKKKLKELERLKEQEDMKKIYQAVKDSGKSVEEILEAVKNMPTPTE